MLNSDEAVKAFSRGGNVTVGGEHQSGLKFLSDPQSGGVADRKQEVCLSQLDRSEQEETSPRLLPIPLPCSRIPEARVCHTLQAFEQ